MSQEAIRKLGVVGVVTIQKWFPNADAFFFTISNFADPLYAFTIIIPLISALDVSLGADVLLVSVIAEWTNILLKWMLMDDRPFWWVRETAAYGSSEAPVLRQTSLTCETGPGSPSGHVQGAAALLYVVVQYGVSHLNTMNTFSTKMRQFLSVTLWGSFGIVILLVALSRLYTATHFPHQTLLGFVAGMATSWLFTGSGRYTLSKHWSEESRPRMLLIALVLTTAAFGAYWLQRLIGVDPQWSVRLAFKWCEQPEWLHVNTTPLYSLVRDSGFIFGMALVSPVNLRVRNQPSYNRVISMVSVIAFILMYKMATEAIPTADVRVFYSCHFMLYAVKPFILFIVIPRLSRLVKLKNE